MNSNAIHDPRCVCDGARGQCRDHVHDTLTGLEPCPTTRRVPTFKEIPMEPDDPNIDEHIREALRVAEEKGRLEVLAAVIDFPGGLADLRKIMSSDAPLSILDRALLVVRLAHKLPVLEST